MREKSTNGHNIPFRVAGLTAFSFLSLKNNHNELKASVHGQSKETQEMLSLSDIEGLSYGKTVTVSFKYFVEAYVYTGTFFFFITSSSCCHCGGTCYLTEGEKRSVSFCPSVKLHYISYLFFKECHCGVSVYLNEKTKKVTTIIKPYPRHL